MGNFSSVTKCGDGCCRTCAYWGGPTKHANFSTDVYYDNTTERFPCTQNPSMPKYHNDSCGRYTSKY